MIFIGGVHCVKEGWGTRSRVLLILEVDCFFTHHNLTRSITLLLCNFQLCCVGMNGEGDVVCRNLQGNVEFTAKVCRKCTFIIIY